MTQYRPRSIPLHLRVTPEQHAQIQKIADEEQRPIASLLALWIRNVLKTYPAMEADKP